ncbi:hypothetical protein PVT68_15065 [Microbulbifer bruguierae]|uniref:Uncharacterized protein n=1 Tax=Microbulbifer bruguierae TaxID=3029061 RepID=A0ABY8NEA3_9GAMM|nr:hypothetical protein [Microbulbifer bruguierae]WGL16082.1 hypothetical protein PVT68_15065 [Microbulbifer bruguierae]
MSLEHVISPIWGFFIVFAVAVDPVFKQGNHQPPRQTSTRNPASARPSLRQPTVQGGANRHWLFGFIALSERKTHLGIGQESAIEYGDIEGRLQTNHCMASSVRDRRSATHRDHRINLIISLYYSGKPHCVAGSLILYISKHGALALCEPAQATFVL